MRDIKFRAWDKNKKAFVDPKNLLHGSIWGDGEKNSAQLTYSSDVYLMQYTGLKDKNGIEIYEGDIVSGTMPDTSKDEDFTAMIVEWVDDGFSVVRQNHIYFGDLISPVLNNCIEVIGNVYENPELVK